MQHLRPTPFDLAFESVAQTTFPHIQTALARRGQDPRDRDAFLMLREVVMLLHELRPEQGLGEGIDQLAALVHHSYLFWAEGSRTVELNAEQLVRIFHGASVTAEAEAETDRPAFYTQLPERRIWAQVIPGGPHEPLDGYFQHSALEPGVLRVLGVFGVHPDRPGFSVVEVSGPRPQALVRPDGSRLFASTLPGGTAAGLFSVAGEEELLDLAWRVRELGSWEPGAESARPKSSLLQAPSS
jgi:hypothetical protein